MFNVLLIVLCCDVCCAVSMIWIYDVYVCVCTVSVTLSVSFFRFCVLVFWMSDRYCVIVSDSVL